MRLLCLFSFVMAGCAKEREIAPREMVDLVKEGFQGFDEGPALTFAIERLAPWLEDNIDSEEADEGYQLEPLDEITAGSVARPPEALLTNLLGAAAGARSGYGLQDQARQILLTDQIFSNPSSYEQYDRTIKGDKDAFRAGHADIKTVNDVTTSTLGVRIPYKLMKDYRWVASDSFEAIVGRSWVEEQSCNSGGGNCLNQSYSLDVFLAAKDGGTLRWTATWSEVETSINVGDDLQIAKLADGIGKIFDKTEEYMDENF